MKTLKTLLLIAVSGFIGYQYGVNRSFNKAVNDGASKAKIATRNTVNKILS